MIDCNLALSYNPTPDMATTNFSRLKEDRLFNESEKILKMNGRYSPFIYRGNYRLSSNYIKNTSNCLILDFDDGLTVDEFKERANFAYAIGTTKSNNIEKNGVISERFRVIIPTETAINLDSREFSDLMEEIFLIFPEADRACKDTARAYSGYPGAEVHIQTGEYFDWEPYYKRAVKRRELKDWQRSERAKAVEVKYEGEGDVKKAMASKFRKIYTSGNRNNAVANIILWAKNEQLPYHEIRELIDSLVQESGDPLNDRELSQIYKYHLR